MKVSEVFYSIQGEGRLAGTPSVFVRVAGCPLRCKWCDTAYAWDATAAKNRSVDDLVAEVLGYNCPHIVITGGEPMDCPELPDFLSGLAAPNRHITVETAGLLFIPRLNCHLMSISPKLSSSLPDDPALAAEHDKLRLNIEAIRNLLACYDYQLKFVIDREKDLDEIKELLRQLPRSAAEHVMLMPQARTREELLQKAPMVAEMCKTSGFAFSDRLQMLLWNGQPGR
jgi:7-carboxy-7-deazaguanine synthase